MTSSFRVLGVLLVVGVLVGGYAAVDGRTQIAAAVKCSGEFHPPAQDVVNLYADAEVIPSGGELELFQVPMGKWLIITDVAVIQTYTPDQAFELVEDLAGNVTLKMEREVMGAIDSTNGNGFQFFQPHVGIVFNPGSRVVILNKHPSQQTLACFMSGFLSKS